MSTIKHPTREEARALLEANGHEATQATQAPAGGSPAAREDAAVRLAEALHLLEQVLDHADVPSERLRDFLDGVRREDGWWWDHRGNVWRLRWAGGDCAEVWFDEILQGWRYLPSARHPSPLLPTRREAMIAEGAPWNAPPLAEEE